MSARTCLAPEISSRGIVECRGISDLGAHLPKRETGKRISRPNPYEQWQVVVAPHLRIVSDELWNAV